jgi:hypothetical protein
MVPSPVHCVECQGEKRFKQGVHVFWDQDARRGQWSGQVAEQHRDLLYVRPPGHYESEVFLGGAVGCRRAVRVS